MLLACLALPTALAAQGDTVVTVMPGPEYAAGALQQRLFGSEYRDLWTTPIRVPVLDLGAYAGGLVVTERSGGRQTRGLRFRGADGREYAFRSVNKFPLTADEPALEGTIVARLLKDQVSSIHPGGALVAAPLLEEVGVLHVVPRLFVMPDDPRLGEFRAEFAGMLGTVEERPDEPEEGEAGADSTFGGFPRIIGTDRLLERLEESPDDRLDARHYLTARLVDLFLNDWDRHADQWRWGQQDVDSVRFWLPIPRDRDYVFSSYDGAAMDLVRLYVPNAVRFTDRIDNLSGLVLNSRDLDRRLLAELEAAEWDSVAAFVQGRLTDEAIDRAVGQMPEEFQPVDAARLAARLKARRADIPAVAREYYARVAREVDVHATDEAELAVVERTGDEVVEVRLYRRDGDSAEPAGEPFFSRRFHGRETHEVRVYLHGGDDHATVRGEVDESIMVRLIGGGGDDVLVDSSAIRNDPDETVLYDDRGDNRLVRGRGTKVDTRSWDPPADAQELGGETPRDWGSGWSLVPVLDYRSIDGVVIGGGREYKRYGFRRHPYAFRYGATARIGLFSGNLGARVYADLNRTNSAWGNGFEVDASQLEDFRFYGFGNDTQRRAGTRDHTVEQHQVEAAAWLTRDLGARGELRFGPVFKYTNPDAPDQFPLGELPRYGNGGFSQAGGFLAVELDRRNDPAYPLRGARVRARASAYPGLLDADGAFGSAWAEATTYLTPPVVPVTLALRAGAERAWGEFPVHEAAFLGGSRTVRGYTDQRYAGDAAVYGNAELRAPLFDAKLILRGTVGALALADVGRVYYDGRSPGGWHSALGGGLWFLLQFKDVSYLASATYARGETDRVYLKLGVPF